MPRHRKVRWGHLSEIDRRIRVGSSTWNGLPRRLKHLTAWRLDHLLGGGHRSIQGYAIRHGKGRPSSNLRLRGPVSKLNYIQRKLGRQKR